MYIVFGRPTRDRQSYTQWIENDIAPQFVIEVGLGSNSETEIEAKRVWHGDHGVKEEQKEERSEVFLSPSVQMLGRGQRSRSLQTFDQRLWECD